MRRGVRNLRQFALQPLNVVDSMVDLDHARFAEKFTSPNSDNC
jgi:hypothetical protein